MSRPLRIEYSGAWYHVMNRGRRGENIFIDDYDYKMFIELLKETSDMWNIRISAYCLMPNHYHILFQTPDANISRGMRHLNGVYTQRFNRRHQCDGQLFRGRYKSILVSADNYILQLVRYIHRNPVKVLLVANIDRYKWVSHKGYLSVAKKWDWLHKNFIFSMLTKNKQAWIKEYKKFVSVESDTKINQVFEGKKLPSVLGAKSFIDWVKGKYYAQKTDDEVPQSRELVPEKDRILDKVCSFYGIEHDNLFISRRGLFNEHRNVALYLFRSLRRDSLMDICDSFGMKKYSSVSSIIERVKARLNNDRAFKKRVKNISDDMIKSQEQT